jgi:hypothetical protein
VVNNEQNHLDALRLRLSHERVRLAHATMPREIELRAVFVAGIEKEIAAEFKFLGIADEVLTLEEILMTDDELLAALEA